VLHTPELGAADPAAREEEGSWTPERRRSVAVGEKDDDWLPARRLAVAVREEENGGWPAAPSPWGETKREKRKKEKKFK
jgi:hypothetical protein